METREYRTIDKSEWPLRGEWDDEPDKVQWQDEATGLPCLIVRGPVGALCGYVGVSEGHPLFGVDYENVNVEVHGGLTFSDFCQHSDDPSRGICHVPGPGEPDRVWWLGFDCAHAWDIAPVYWSADRYGWEASYKPLAYVKSQVTKLAEQLAEYCLTKRCLSHGADRGPC